MRSYKYTKRKRRGGVGPKSKNEKSKEGKELKKQLKSLFLEFTKESNPIIRKHLQEQLQKLSHDYNRFIKRSPEKSFSPKKSSKKVESVLVPLIPKRQKASYSGWADESDEDDLAPQREPGQNSSPRSPYSPRFRNYGGTSKTKKRGIWKNIKN